MALEFSICEVRWERYRRVSENPQAREWLKFQAARGLAANTIEAYGRDLDSYLGFLETENIPFHSVIRPTIGAYIRSITQLEVPRVSRKGMEARSTLANATLQQHLTVVRLFHDFLVEERVCTRNPLRPLIGGRGLIQRHHRLPWIPSEEEWQNILQVCKQEPLRNRVMLAMSYDAALRREEICSLEVADIDPAHRLLRIRLELQEWLGHRMPSSTQRYAKITPTKLMKSYSDAGYFGRNLRAIDVLIDQEKVRNGVGAAEAWKFYDLGHGYCTYDFFDQRPHRMACAKCSFYLPKGSTMAALLEGKNNLLRMRQEIPLSDAELAALDDGVSALESLLSRLADVPTPAGPTPLQLRDTALIQIEAAG